MRKEFEINIDLEAGKKKFTITFDENLYQLTESGSLVAVLSKNEIGWKLQKGSYNESDVQKIGEMIAKTENAEEKQL